MALPSPIHLAHGTRSQLFFRRLLFLTLNIDFPRAEHPLARAKNALKLSNEGLLQCHLRRSHHSSPSSSFQCWSILKNLRLSRSPDSWKVARTSIMLLSDIDLASQARGPAITGVSQMTLGKLSSRAHKSDASSKPSKTGLINRRVYGSITKTTSDIPRTHRKNCQKRHRKVCKVVRSVSKKTRRIEHWRDAVGEIGKKIEKLRVPTCARRLGAGKASGNVGKAPAAGGAR
jgi:hypothetical protein